MIAQTRAGRGMASGRTSTAERARNCPLDVGDRRAAAGPQGRPISVREACTRIKYSDDKFGHYIIFFNENYRFLQNS